MMIRRQIIDLYIITILITSLVKIDIFFVKIKYILAMKFIHPNLNMISLKLSLHFYLSNSLIMK